MLRPLLQHHRAIHMRAAQPQRIAAVARRLAQTHPDGPRHRHGSAGLDRQSGQRLRLPGHRKAIFNRSIVPNIPENPRERKTPEAWPQAAL
jgi:hypothetical protein